MGGPSHNSVLLLGRLTRDPELKSVGESSKVAKFGLAVNGYKDHTDFFEVEAWNKTAEAVAQYQKKGALVLIDGRMSQQRWEDKNDGKKRSKVVVTANSIKFLTPKPKDAEGGSAPDSGSGDVDF